MENLDRKIIDLTNGRKCIIEFGTTPKYNEKGEKIFVGDPDKCIIETTGIVSEITFYEPEEMYGNKTGRFIPIILEQIDIKKLHEFVVAAEKIEQEEFWD